MSGYAKHWTAKYGDLWFMSLKLIERGFWDELIDLAKLHGDTGVLSFNSWSAMGVAMGCDGKTCRKIAGKFLQNGKINSHLVDANCKFAGKIPKGKIPAGKILLIKIVNYEYNQRVRKPDGPPASGNFLQTSGQSDQIKPMATEKTKNPDHQSAIDYWCNIYNKHIGVAYNFVGKKEGPIIKRLLKAYGLTVLKQIMDQMFITQDEFITKQAGRTLGVLSACVNKLAQEVMRQNSPLDQLSPAGRSTAINAMKVLEDLKREESENS